LPGARHSRHSKAGRSRRRRYGHRDVAKRSPLPVIVIVCDDSRTAPAYFRVLKREVKQYVTLNVVPATCQASPSTVVDQAVAERNNLRRDGEDQDAVWVLIDLEHEPNTRQQAEAERNRAEAAALRVARSDPCYEVWTLLHLQDTGEAFTSCNQVIKRIASAWNAQFGQRFQRKAQADYTKIAPMRRQAACRAKRHWEARDPSRTEVYKAVEEIESHERQSPPAAST
jgi:hypothetical protein